MNARSLVPTRPRAWLIALALALFPAALAAQTGTVRGTVSGEDGRAVSGARVAVEATDQSAVTDARGAFTLSDVPAGTHRLTVTHPNYLDGAAEAAVASGETAMVAVRLERAPIALDPLVVAAGRQAERVTEAPATITRIGPEVLDATVGNTFAGALKEVQGLDFIQVGVTSVGINARGFNSSFNNRMLMLEDGRVAVLPENGLPVGQFTATPKVDLAGIEVLVGPGAALYGADASSGVIALTTKDPRDYPGTTVEITGGSREYRDVQARHAGVFGNWGYKVAGEYQAANDFENLLTYPIAVGGDVGTVMVREDQLPGNTAIDFDSEVLRGTGAVTYYMGDSRFELSAGLSETDGVGQTNVGRNQLRGWGYNFQQARFTSPNWYVNLYRTQSTSGESFAINRAADAYARNPDMDPEALRLASDWPSDGRMYAGEVQTNFSVPQLLDTHFVVGGQFRRDAVSSDRQWLTDRSTGEDIQIDQYGVYGQATAPVAPWMDVVLAARLDDHENYDRQFSPKAGLVFKPAPAQAFRITYNRAFKSPTILQTNFFIPDWTAAVSIYGNTRGFTVTDAQGAVVREYEPLQPEENTTWEAGYKGVIADRLFVDWAVYRSDYENFMSPLAIIADPFNLGLAGYTFPTFASFGDGEAIVHPGGYPPVALTYYNLGAAELTGSDLGLNYLLTPRVSLKGTVSYVSLDEDALEVEAGREEATALNSPEWKWTLGATATEVNGFTGGATVRHVDEYYFRSGINMGRIPSFTTLDLNLGYRLPSFGRPLISVGVSNLFACAGEFTYADATVDPFRQNPVDEERECGFDTRHIEMINMPEIGTMVFVGLKYDLP